MQEYIYVGGGVSLEMPQKPLLWNFRFIFGNPSKLGKGEGFPNIFESFPNVYS